jgi:hypothetical protein
VPQGFSEKIDLQGVFEDLALQLGDAFTRRLVLDGSRAAPPAPAPRGHVSTQIHGLVNACRRMSTDSADTLVECTTEMRQGN